MVANIIDGTDISKKVREEIAHQVTVLKETGITPGLAVLLVGDKH
jgi:methylenetetrahydrofolate dehydrogenase (NADP+) / methenyltetrahydrofolate cyclohydrolase